MSEKSYANIMVIGQTGVGKSSFLNYLIGEERFKINVGRPVTQGFDTYEYDNINGIPIRVYDSKGLEVKDFSVIKETLVNYLKTQCGKSDPLKWIHSIFYCINVKGGRLQKEEINFVRNIRNAISQTVHIVLTNCDTPDCSQVQEMETYIRNVFNNPMIIKVNSVETNTRKHHYKQFGRETALNAIFRVLWSDIAYRVSKQYARELKNGLDRIYNSVISAFDTFVDAVTPINIIKEFINEGGFEKTLHDVEGKLDRELDREMDKLSSKYVNIINPLVEFCNEYSMGLGYRVYLMDCADFIPERCINKLDDIDIDEILSSSRMGRLMDEMDRIDGDDLFSIFKMLGKTVGALLTVHSLMKDVVSDIKYELRKMFPTEQEIADEMYKQLMQQMESAC